MPVVSLMFGSGEVEAIIATDVVRVGSVSTSMEEGVLLMVNHALKLSGPFEGILGLGPPRNVTEVMLQEEWAAREPKRIAEAVSQSVADTSKAVGDDIEMTKDLKSTEKIKVKIVNDSLSTSQAMLPGKIFSPKSFLQSANVDRFSVCFNDGGLDGALNLRTPKVEHTLTSIGQA